MTLSPEVASVLATLAITTALSIAASFFSHYLRLQRARGVKSSPVLLALAAALNMAAANPHKAVRLAKASDAAKEAK